MSKEEVLKDYDFRKSSTQAAIKLFDAICNRGWNLRQGDYEIMKGVIREFSSNYAASLLAEKEREIANKHSLINALERDVFHYSGNLQNTEEEIVKLKALIHEAYNQTYPNEQSWSDFKEKHNL